MIDPKAVDAVLAIFVPLIQAHRQTSPSSSPYVLGLSGLQGSGKSTWAAALSAALIAQHGLKTRILSLDDLYSDHAELVALREANPDNGLLQTRGQPGTHDEALAQKFFSQVLSVNSNKSPDAFIKWPAYDKSLHSGQGGRVPVEQWEKVPVSEGLDVLIFEGWCLGFQPLSAAQVEAKWEADKAHGEPQTEETALVRTLAGHALSHLQLINDNLARYCDSFAGPRFFDGFLHLSTDRLMHVYEWRLGQEEALRRHKPGMTDEQVVRFVRGYMPAYELFLSRLQTESFFRGQSGDKKHVQVVLNKGREVEQVKELE
ncbi:P-loop containing nucleoside triphosphate hydrolase protein [Dactylonectria estremocensis]|uniref:P-loop containing nucleoside triphosphate hydrolase protein n=1 Tax=Dactylonectria estremocensis TaxID=1079267 RepID=A0A9P9F807_9HYPO|nr:P-loop containing nucleoside triphosphate hydrolase protein [Dactylonectria estremocensis]